MALADKLLGLITPTGWNLDELFSCDASTNDQVLRLLLVLKVGLLFCSLNKQEGEHTVEK